MLSSAGVYCTLHRGPDDASDLLTCAAISAGRHIASGGLDRKDIGAKM